MGGGPSSSSSSITAAPQRRLLAYARYPSFPGTLAGLFPYILVRKRAFYSVCSSVVSDTFYQLFNTCCSTLNTAISRVLGFFTTSYQSMDKLTNLFAFHGALLRFFVMKQKSGLDSAFSLKMARCPSSHLHSVFTF